MNIEVFICFILLCIACMIGFTIAFISIDKLKDEIKGLKKELRSKSVRLEVKKELERMEKNK